MFRFIWYDEMKDELWLWHYCGYEPLPYPTNLVYIGEI